MDLHAENILSHHRNPRRKGKLKKPTIEHSELNPSCGDSLKLQLTIRGNRIAEIGWDGTGCALSQGGMSMLAEELPNMTTTDVAALLPRHMRSLLGVPISTRRLKCALLPLLTLHNALRSCKHLPPETWAELLEEDDT